MSHLQQQAQEKNAEIHRQQRNLQTLRVRTYCYKLTFLTLVVYVMAASGTQIQKNEQLAAVQQLQLSLTETVRIDRLSLN